MKNWLARARTRERDVHESLSSRCRRRRTPTNISFYSLYFSYFFPVLLNLNPNCTEDSTYARDAARLLCCSFLFNQFIAVARALFEYRKLDSLLIISHFLLFFRAGLP